jgi:hypothetical protein
MEEKEESERKKREAHTHSLSVFLRLFPLTVLDMCVCAGMYKRKSVMVMRRANHRQEDRGGRRESDTASRSFVRLFSAMSHEIHPEQTAQAV